MIKLGLNPINNIHLPLAYKSKYGTLLIFTTIHRWRMVVHAGIDGYSRLIVYLNVSDNNQAFTVIELFHLLSKIMVFHHESDVI